jgi:hypothetical protein
MAMRLACCLGSCKHIGEVMIFRSPDQPVFRRFFSFQTLSTTLRLSSFRASCPAGFRHPSAADSPQQPRLPDRSTGVAQLRSSSPSKEQLGSSPCCPLIPERFLSGIATDRTRPDWTRPTCLQPSCPGNMPIKLRLDSDAGSACFEHRSLVFERLTPRRRRY